MPKPSVTGWQAKRADAIGHRRRHRHLDFGRVTIVPLATDQHAGLSLHLVECGNWCRLSEFRNSICSAGLVLSLPGLVREIGWLLKCL